MESRRWLSRIGDGVGYVLTRGSLIAVGGAAVFFGYTWGWGDGSDSGFMAGCRATTADAGCVYAEKAGRQIRRLKRDDVGRSLRGVALNQGKIDVICDDLRDHLSRQAAAHYGCDDR